MHTRSWLMADSDRRRMLDMDRRLRPVRRRTLLLLGAGLVAFGPWVGWWTLAPLALAGGAFALAERMTRGSQRPEYWMLGAWLIAEAVIAASAGLTGTLIGATVGWLAIPVVTLSARFSARGVALGVLGALLCLAAAMLSVNAHAVIADPPLLAAPAGTIVAIAILSWALHASDVEHRSRAAEALVDGLTGMLNRTALSRRVEELAQQSRVSGEPVAIIVADIDEFKQINDTAGHATGDAILREVAYRLRKRMRAFEAAYRLGGEEFLILLAGARLKEAHAVAEKLRADIESQTFTGGQSVTMSFGVSASAAGSGFEYEPVFASADEALYRAKQAGRNHVCVQACSPPPPGDRPAPSLSRARIGAGAT